MFEKILLAVDGSPFSADALRVASNLAVKLGAQVEVVHVHEHETYGSKAGAVADLETPEESGTVLAGAIAELTGHGVPAHARLLQARRTDVAAKIIEAADAVGAELIVVGSRGLSNLSAILLGSVSESLVRHARRPVLVVHEVTGVEASAEPVGASTTA